MEVLALYERYNSLPLGNERRAWRRLHPELDEWMLRTGKVTKTIAQQDEERLEELGDEDEEQADRLSEYYRLVAERTQELQELRDRLNKLRGK